MAEELRTDAVDNSVFKAPKELSILHELARVHSMLVGGVIRVPTRHESIYRSRSIPVAGLAVYGAKSGAEHH